jgi:serine/threonine protein kinase
MKRDDFTFPHGSRIGRYEVSCLIGAGGFSRVYKVVLPAEQEVFALKTERIGATERSFLENEIACLAELAVDCFPRIHDHGTQGDLQFMVMGLYGRSLSMIADNYERNMPLNISLPLCCEMLRVIGRLHSLGYIHRDIKPANFLVSSAPSAPLVLVDFGVAARHIDSSTGLPFPADANPAFVGTRKFASPFAHSGSALGRRDDLISWFYSAVDLVTGTLPWAQCKDQDELAQMKRRPPEQLCEGMPPEFVEIYTYLKKLQYKSSPDYRYIRERLNAVAERKEIVVRSFNWDKFYLKHSALAEEKPKKEKRCAVV